MIKKILVLVSICFFSSCAQKVTWIGSPGIARPDKYFLNDAFVVSIEIGIRQDGVVVWRERKEEK